MNVLKHFVLFVSFILFSASELVIDVQPNVISAEITSQLVINCSITNNQVQQLDVIRSLTLSHYNETLKEFLDLLTLETKTLNLSQLVQLHHAQISFGNLYISLTLHNPTQFDAKVYRCKVDGDKTDAANSSIVAKKEVEYRTNTTALIEEIRRLKIVENNDQCTFEKAELTASYQKTKLHFGGSSKVIKKLIEPLTLTCSLQVLKQDLKHNSTVQFMYILHETNGVIATINKDQPVVTTKQESNFNMAKGKLSDTNLQKSFIEVSWSYLKSLESGKYFCGAHVLGPNGRSERLNKMLAITVSNPTFDDLVEVITKLLRHDDKEKENILENKQNINNIKEEINTKQQNIISIKDGLDNNRQDIKTIKDDLETCRQSIKTMTDDLNTKKQNIASYNNELNTIRQIVNNVQGDLSISKQSIQSIFNDLDNKKESISSHNGELNTLRQIVNSLKDDLRTSNQSLQSVTDDVNTNKQNINQLKEDLKSNKNNLQNVTQGVNTNRQNIITLNKDVNYSQESLSKLETNVETQLTNLSTTLAQVKEKLGKGLQISCREINSFQERVMVKLISGLYVMCDTKTDGGGWIVFQRRINGKVDFYRGWKEYRDGFGDYNIGEFYLGNENIFKLTTTEKYDLRIDLEFNNTKYFAQYENFKILSETEKYKLQIGKYSGNAYDSLSYHNNNYFSTFDRDNDEFSDTDCAEYSSGAWWYGFCHYSNLNGKWGSTSLEKGLNWRYLTGWSDSVSFSEMKIRESEKNYFD